MAQTVRTWLGVSRPAWTTIYGVWTAGWRGVGSPAERCRGALERDTEPLHCSLAFKGLPSHSVTFPLMHVSIEHLQWAHKG